MTKNLKQRRVERWAWILIYGGLLFVVFSIFLARYERTFADGLQVGGALATVAGAVLIWLRSRMK